MDAQPGGTQIVDLQRLTCDEFVKITEKNDTQAYIYVLPCSTIRDGIARQIQVFTHNHGASAITHIEAPSEIRAGERWTYRNMNRLLSMDVKAVDILAYPQ
jgi:hypothetical protein